MRSSVIFISLVFFMGLLTAPVSSRMVKTSQYENSENGEVLIDSNAIPQELNGYFYNFFSNLTPNKLRGLLRSNHWADEVPISFEAEPDVATPVKSYQELYNDFLESRNQRF